MRSAARQWLSHRSLIGLRLLRWMVLWWNGHPESWLWAMACIGKPAMAQRLGTIPQFQVACVLHKNTWPSFQPLKLANVVQVSVGNESCMSYQDIKRGSWEWRPAQLLPRKMLAPNSSFNWLASLATSVLQKQYNTNCVQLPVWPCFDLDSLNQGRRMMRGWRVASQSTWVAGIGPFRNRCSNMRRPTSQLTRSWRSQRSWWRTLA